MITSQLNELELAEVWAQEDSETRFKLAAALSSGLCQLKTLGERSYSSRSISQEKLCAFNRSLPDRSPRATSGSGMPSPDGSAPLLGGDAPAENAQRSDQTVPESAVLAPAT